MPLKGNTSSQGKSVDAATSISATSGNAQATVSFTLPVKRGKGTPTYTVISSPGGITASGNNSPIIITGLSNGTAYTFTVTTVSGYGVSSTTGNTNSVSPVAPPFFPFFPSFGPFFPPSFCNPCPSGGVHNGGYCYYNCGTGNGSCGCGPGSPTGYVSPQGTADCYYGASC